MNDNIVLEVSGLTTQFRAEGGMVTAVNDLSFNVDKGKILGIVGESGCGKSVTLLSIMRLISSAGGIISKGSVIFDGRDILKLSEREMRSIRGNRMAMIFQEPMTSLNPVFTVGYQMEEVVKLHLGLRGNQARQRCTELLQTVGIPRADKVIDEYPHQLSGGMRQRVMIAMAIACSPQLLIADEPTTALDVTIQAQVLGIMKSLIRETDMSIIFITHDLGVIAEMADDVAIMYAGRIVEYGGVNDIFLNPLNAYTQGLMASRPSLAKRGTKLSCIEGIVPSLADLPEEGCAFAARCNKSSEICHEKTPKLLIVDGSHSVRCFDVGGGDGDGA